MRIGKACAIFDNIESSDYTEIEKRKAINMVLKMPTHNSFTKATMLKVIKWLWNLELEESEMTIEEARKVLDGELLVLTLENNVASETQKKRLTEKFAALNVAISALDKQIPKKPTEYDSVPHARCPHCTKGVRVYCDSAKVPFCQWCGQALDWSEKI